jgi:hypothetical protein
MKLFIKSLFYFEKYFITLHCTNEHLMKYNFE